MVGNSKAIVTYRGGTGCGMTHCTGFGQNKQKNIHTRHEGQCYKRALHNTNSSRLTCLEAACRANHVRLSRLDVLHVDLHGHVAKEEVPDGHSTNNRYKQVPVVDHDGQHEGVPEHVVEQEDGGFGEKGTNAARQGPQSTRGEFQREQGGGLTRRRTGPGPFALAGRAGAHLGAVDLKKGEFVISLFKF